MPFSIHTVTTSSTQILCYVWHRGHAKVVLVRGGMGASYFNMRYSHMSYYVQRHQQENSMVQFSGREWGKATVYERTLWIQCECHGPILVMWCHVPTSLHSSAVIDCQPPVHNAHTVSQSVLIELRVLLKSIRCTCLCQLSPGFVLWLFVLYCSWILILALYLTLFLDSP